MITGFNTDIKHAERVFHVQTEDRGISNPIVESLVYVGGEILLSKKSPYKDHIQGDQVDEKVVKEMMDLQHRRIIEAIRRGRFDAAKPGEAGVDEAPEASAANQVSPAAAAAAAAILSSRSGVFPKVAAPAVARPVISPPPASAPGAAHAATAASRGETQVTPPPGDRSLDQVIIDYLASEAASEHLELSLMTGGDLISGEPVSLSIRTSTSLTEKPVAGAHVSVRVVSTSGPPQVLFRGVSGNDGFIKATCAIPEIGVANAALIVAASSPLGNNELKQLIKRKAR